MDTKVAEVEKLVDWRIANLPDGATVADVVESFKRGTFNTGEPLPEGVTIGAVRDFRKRGDDAKRRLVVRALGRSQTTRQPAIEKSPATPSITGTVPSTPSIATAEIKPVRTTALAEIARLTSLELKEVAGEIFITLRCFEPLIGKRPENLRRTLEARGFPITEVSALNVAGNTRPTPAIHIAYIFAVVGLADLHGMDEQEKARLFKLQREMPTWLKRFDKILLESQPKILLESQPKEEPSFLALVNTMSSKILTVMQEGLVKLASRFDLRFDRIEHLLRVSGASRSTAEGPPVDRNRTRQDAPKTRDLERINGTWKISSRGPLKSITDVVKEVNQHLNTFFMPEEIVQMAKKAGIYEREFWGMNKVGVENSTILESGDMVTWWFDADSRNVIKDVARKECITINGATLTPSP
jgi:hypothetical protein